MASALVCLSPGKCPVTSEYLSEVTGQMVWIWDIYFGYGYVDFCMYEYVDKKGMNNVHWGANFPRQK